MDSETDERSEAFERGLKTMERVALELYRRGREEARGELETVKRERDEARAALASCTDCAMWAERSARWHDGMQRAERERDEARAEVERLHLDVGCLQLGLTVASEAYRAGYMAGSREAFRRGAEAMREACAVALLADGLVLSRERAANVVRALPIQEEA